MNKLNIINLNQEKIYVKYRIKVKYKNINIRISDFYGEKDSKKIKEYVNKTLDLLPKNILDYLIINNFTINIVSRRYLNIFILQDLYGQDCKVLKKDKLLHFWKNRILKTREGYYIWGRKEIFTIYKKNDFERLLLHEIAHFLDYKGKFNIDYQKIIKMINKNYFRRIDELNFYNVYCCEKKKSNFRKYYKNKPSEYFAEFFARYILNINKVEKYKAICKKINKLEKSCTFVEDFIKLF